MTIVIATMMAIGITIQDQDNNDDHWDNQCHQKSLWIMISNDGHQDY